MQKAKGKKMVIAKRTALFFFIFLQASFFVPAFPMEEKIREAKQGVEMAQPISLYKIVTPEQWRDSRSKEFLSLSSFDSPFIHLAEEGQLPHVVEKFWKEKAHVILKVKVEALQGRLVHETNPGGTTLYYHLYEGRIPTQAIEEWVVHQ